MNEMQIEISYGLYTDDGHAGRYEPVTAEADLAIQSHLADADTDKRVDYHPDPGVQEALLHQHVTGVPFDLPVDGHEIDFVTKEPSRWDVVTKTWVYGPGGASLIDKVRAKSGKARLFLAVWTMGGEIATPAVAMSGTGV